MVKARFGLDGAPARTLEEIGRDFNLTRERVRQIEARALHKLRQPYRNYRVRDFAFDKLLVQAGMLKPPPGAVAAAEAVIAEAEAAAKRSEAALAHERLGTTPEEGITSELHSLLGERSMSRGLVVGKGEDKSGMGKCLLEPSLVGGKGGMKLEKEFDVRGALGETGGRGDGGVGLDKDDLLALEEASGGDFDTDTDMDAELRSLNKAWKNRRSPREAAEQLAQMGIDSEGDVRAPRLQGGEGNEQQLGSTLDGLDLDLTDLEDDDSSFDDDFSGTDSTVLSGSPKTLDRLESAMNSNGGSVRLEERDSADMRSLQVA